MKARREKWKNFEHRNDYGRFKPNQDSNQPRVLGMTIDEDNTNKIIVNPNQFKIQSIKEVNSIRVKRSSIVRKSSNKSKSYADALKLHPVDNSRAIDTNPSNIGKQKIELRAQDDIAEKKSNPGNLNSEGLMKIYINLMEDEKEQASLILD